MTVCSHPQDGVTYKEYTDYGKSFASWFPQNVQGDVSNAAAGVARNSHLTVLLGNSFTSTTHARPWNLTDDGLRKLRSYRGATIEVSTDRLSGKNEQYSDLPAVAQQYMRQALPSTCAQMDANSGRVTTAAQVSGTLLSHIPNAMYLLAQPDSKSRAIDFGSDPVVQAISAMSPEGLRDFVKTHSEQIASCSLDPQQFMQEAKR